MATLKRQRADGTYDLVEMYGKFVKLKELYIAQSDNITTIPIQNSFTKVTDHINVYCEGLKLVENDNFTISVDNRTIELKDWDIKTGDKIEIEIYKNAIDIDRLASGSQLEDFSVDKIKLSQALQDEISNGGNAVKSVNNVLPDENGNVQVNSGSDYVVTSPKLPESIDYKDGFTFFQPSKTGDASTGVDYQQAWYNYLTTQFPHIISDNVNISETSHSIKVFTFHRYVSGKGTTPHEKIRQQEIHMVHPVDGTVYKFERLCSTTTWSIKITYDFKKHSIKSINNILPDENGNVNIEMQGGGNSFFKSYNLPTTTVGQKAWSLPANSYDSNADSIVIFYNGDLLGSDEYTITGNITSGYQVNMENPIEEIEDNNIIAVVLRNARSDEPNEMSGLLLTDDSVAMDKLGQDVKDAIANAGSKVDIIDDLTSSRTDAVVSARVSKMIYDEIGYIDNRIDEHSMEKASSNSTGHVKPDDITTKTDATGKMSVITTNDFTGGVDKVASAEIIKTLKGQLDNTKSTIDTYKSNWDAGYNVYTRFQGECVTITDWNLATLNGMYMGANVMNAPTTDWHMGITIAHNDLYIVQKVIGVTNGREYERQKYNGVWENWIETSPRQLFQSVSNGKALVANAITGKGVSTSTTAEFATMASNINAIPTGGRKWSGTLNSISGTTAFTRYNGSGTDNLPSITFILPFNPSVISSVFYSSDPIWFATNAHRSGSPFSQYSYNSAEVVRLNGTYTNTGSIYHVRFTITPSGGNYLVTIPVGLVNTTYNVVAYE